MNAPNRKRESTIGEPNQGQRRRTQEMINASERDRTNIDGRRGRNSIGVHRDSIVNKSNAIQEGGRENMGGDRDGMVLSLTNAVGNDSNGGGKSEVIRPTGVPSAELSGQVASAGGNGDGEWSVHSVDLGGDKRDNRGSLPSLDGVKEGGGGGPEAAGGAAGEPEGGNEDVDGECNSATGEPEEVRVSGKRSRSARQRKSTRALRKGGGGGGGSGAGEDAGLSPSGSSTKGRKSSRRVGQGEGGAERKGRTRSRAGEQEEGNREEMPAHEEFVENGRAHLSPSSISSSISMVPSGPGSVVSNDERIEAETTVGNGARRESRGVESRDESSSAEGRRARPPRLDL